MKSKRHEIFKKFQESRFKDPGMFQEIFKKSQEVFKKFQEAFKKSQEFQEIFKKLQEITVPGNNVPGNLQKISGNFQKVVGNINVPGNIRRVPALKTFQGISIRFLKYSKASGNIKNSSRKFQEILYQESSKK